MKKPQFLTKPILKRLVKIISAALIYISVAYLIFTFSKAL